MAFQLPRAPTAFALSPGKKRRPREHNKAHLEFIRELPCLVTGTRPVEAAHIRYAELRWGKFSVGISEKPHDKWSVPLAPLVHRDQHAAGDERGWWKLKGIDPVLVAMALWANTGDHDACIAIITAARIGGGIERR